MLHASGALDFSSYQAMTFSLFVIFMVDFDALEISFMILILQEFPQSEELVW